MTSRPIKLMEAYTGLRNEGLDPFAAGFLAVLWWMRGVRVEG